MKQQRGFTLIEIMVAVLISAILAALAFESMQLALKNRDRIHAGQARLEALQFTMGTLVKDLSQLYPRPVREPAGPGYQPAVYSGVEPVFTSGGWMNALGVERSNLRRVRYALREKKLIREYWLVLDAQFAPEPVSRQLLDGVKSFKFRYMNSSREWQDEWPPASRTGGARSQSELGSRPIAVEVTLELEDFGVLTRIVEVAG